MPFGMTRDVMRPPDSPRTDRVTYVELFFDLVFVFALTQLSAYLYENQDAVGALEGLIMVCALWWAWVSTTWVTNWLDPVKLPVRGAVVALAFVSFVMSASIAEAFGDRAARSPRVAGLPLHLHMDRGGRRALDRRGRPSALAAAAVLDRSTRPRT